ncbi:DUF5658 family protein [Neobacillus sp. PS3-34]|uniref:DUF5658 family protein n=1 Tax=Neobacillus sp. PS3-34 TaxID=3070678 RepID=UPI0027DFF3F5|nr:DUF5658 family protein [Neobacillus sp. PS3-34]WML48223.1 DUF5658 family protein [Neobacillus sp. PS3-34]
MNKLLIYLSAANLIDGVATFFGLHLNIISEDNFIMEFIYHISPALFLFLKVSLSISLIIFVYKLRKSKRPFLYGLAMFASAVYTITLFIHIYWLIGIL